MPGYPPNAQRRTVAVTFDCRPTAGPNAASRSDSCTSVIDLIDAVAQRRPHVVAAETESSSLTYAALVEASSLVAKNLRREGVGPESRVAICAEAGIDSLVFIVGILRAGGAYVPLDPTQPSLRLRWVLNDCGALLLVTTEESQVIARSVAAGASAKLLTSPELLRNGRCHDATSVESLIAPDCLAYVIYTSGSAGRPKGVLIEHGGLAEMARVHASAFSLGPGSRVLQFSSLTFDASVHEIFSALTSGATLCFAERDRLLPGRALLETLAHRKVSCVLLPPFVWESMPRAALPHLRTAIAGGDRCTSQAAMIWGRGRDFFNAYGPTESTVTATLWRCDPTENDDPPIGPAREGIEAFVLDVHGRDVGQGEPGELYLSGRGIARGYLNEPKQTAERFVELARPSGTIVRAFRTGDCVVSDSDGVLRFVGRFDRQVKIRGHRIEPGEIEIRLQRHPDIREAAVVSYRRGTAVQLAAVCTVTNCVPLSAADVRNWLRSELPSYMMPTRIVFAERLPRNQNGKLDYAALARQVEESVADADESLASTSVELTTGSATENLLLPIWRSVIGTSDLNRDDHFIEAGGDSLCAAHIAARAEEIGLFFTAGELLAHPTVTRLGMFLDEKGRNGAGRGN